MQTVLITGGAGFIGSSLIDIIDRDKYRIKVFDNLSTQIHGHVPHSLEFLDSVEFIRGSLLDLTLLNEVMQGVDIVIHLAAETGTGQSMYNIAQYVCTNDLGTANILNIIANNDKVDVKRFVLASSRSVYGEGAYFCGSCDTRYFPKSRDVSSLKKYIWDPVCPTCNSTLNYLSTKESDLIQPASIYAATKYTQENLVRITCESLGLDYAILRFQNVYGENQSLTNPYTGILTIFANKLKLGLDLPIFEDGNETRDFVHVSDVANALNASLDHVDDIKQVINVGSGVATSIKQVAELLCDAFDITSNILITSQYRVGDIRHNCADITLLKNVLGVVPAVKLDVGLRKFANWVNEQPAYQDLVSVANNELAKRNLLG